MEEVLNLKVGRPGELMCRNDAETRFDSDSSLYLLQVFVNKGYCTVAGTVKDVCEVIWSVMVQENMPSLEHHHWKRNWPGSNRSMLQHIPHHQHGPRIKMTKGASPVAF